MEKISLYELVDGIKKIEELADDSDSLTAYLDSVNLQIKDKINNVIKYTRTLELTSDAISNEISRLSDLKKYYDNRGENLKKYLAYNLEKLPDEKIETDFVKLSFRKSESVILVDESKIPNEYKKEVINIKIDKIAIKQAIKDGKEVQGAIIESKKNLQIK